MLRVGAVILAIGFYIYSVIDIIRTSKTDTRTLPKYVWLIIAIFLPVIGGIFWLLFGRIWPQRGYRSKRNAPKAPDDDPKFLRTLDDRTWSEKMRKRREQNP